MDSSYDSWLNRLACRGLRNPFDMFNSKWGLRGNEDLGGGMGATFWLENGFNVSTGKLNNGGDLFGRQAYVGLTSNQYGAVTLGRLCAFTSD